MALSPTPLSVGTAESIALTDFNTAINLLNAAFPLIAANLGDDALVTRHFLSFLDRQRMFYDCFMGAVVDDAWAVTCDPGGSAIIATGGVLIIETVATINKKCRIDWSGNKSFLLNTALPKMSGEIPTHVVNNVRFLIALYNDADNYVGFRYDTSIDANWRAVCRKAAAETVVDTGVTDLRGFKIDYVNTSKVQFYADGVLKATIETNVPLGVSVEPYLRVETLAGLQRQLILAYLLIIGTQ